MYFFSFIVTIVLAFYVHGLRGRVSELESRLSGQQAKRQTEESVVVPTENVVDENGVFVPEPPPGVAKAAPLPVEEGPTAVDRFVEWVREDFLVKLGAFLLLIAFGWFVSYAFANDWIGPIGRITLGLLAGIGFVIGGQFRIKNYTSQGGIFLVVGSTIILATVWAARGIYDFFTPLSALFIMFLPIAYTTLQSMIHNRKSLALASLILASIAPLLTASTDPTVSGLYTYLLIVVVGTLWVVYIKGWAELSFAALLVVSFYGFPMATYSNILGKGSSDTLLMFAFIFTGLFFMTNIASMIRSGTESVSRTQLITALGTGIYMTLWIYIAAAQEWQSLLFVSWMLVFSFGAFAVYRTLQNSAPFYIYGAISVALLGAATAAELNGAMLVIAFTLEVAAILLVAMYLTRNESIVRSISILFGIPILFSLPHLEPYRWSDGIVDSSTFAVATVMMALLIVGDILGNRSKGKGLPKLQNTAIVLTVVGGMYAVAFVWLALHGIMNYDVATMLSLIIYTVFGVSFSVYGRKIESAALNASGTVLIGGVVARLLLVDVWEMELATRIIVFFVVGALLMATSFFAKREKTIIIEE